MTHAARRGDLSLRRLIWFRSLLTAAALAGIFGVGWTLSGGQPPANDPVPPDRTDPMTPPFSDQIPAPSLDGGVEWFNAAGPLDLKDLRGKFVLLDFWTYCCINCMHILPELKKLEQAYPRELVVIGVHSAKFDAERDSKNIREAILRYEIEHPVVNDANHAIWNKYYVSSWPSLRLIDPKGNLVGGHSGEITFEALKEVFERAILYYRDNGSLDLTPLRFDLEQDKASQTPLRFPGKVLADESGSRLFIADSSHNRVVVCTLDGRLIDVIGSGVAGHVDGDFLTARFNHPQGMALDGEVLYLADTEGHRLRKIDLKQKTVTTIAGTGQQARNFPGVKLGPDGETVVPNRFAGKPLETALNSPWDLLIHKDQLYIAMAGPHQIWKMPLNESEIGLFAGSGREDIVDGPLYPKEPYQQGIASFAQPSGLATDGHALFVADSEGSSIRSVSFSPSGRAQTIIGTAHLPFNRLFTFGDVDGRGATVQLQHPLGLAWADGHLYVADTYNNKIKRIDVKRKTCETVAGTGAPGHDDVAPTFDEPAGISAAGGRLYVADTNNHRIRVIALNENNKVSTLEIAGLEPPRRQLAVPQAMALFEDARPIDVPAVMVTPKQGKVRLAVSIKLPEGYKLNEQAPMAYQVSLAGAAAAADEDFFKRPHLIEKPQNSFDLDVPLTANSTEDVLTLSLNYHYCQKGAEGVCKMSSVAWKVPLKFQTTGATDRIPLSTTP
jgi:sugar lactone lactonase YvrE/thiol-disulfide isomerase/thioredoxin